MKYSVLFILITTLTYTSYSQQKASLSTLLNQLENSTHDSSKIQTLIALGDYYLLSNFDSMQYYYDQSLGLVEQSTDNKLDKYEPLVYRKVCIAFTTKRQSNKGLEYAKKSIAAYQRLNMPIGESNMYILMGVLHSQLGKIEEGKRFLKKAIELKEKLNTSVKLGESYMNLTEIYMKTGELEKALTNIDKAIEVFIQQKNNVSEYRSYIIKSGIHSASAQYDKALALLHKTRKLYANNSEINDPRAEVNILVDISSIHAHLGNIDKSIVYLKESLLLVEKGNDNYQKGILHYNIAGSYIDKLQFKNALTHSQKALEYYSIIGYRGGIASAYSLIGEAYRGLKKYDLSLKNYEEAIKLTPEEDKSYGNTCRNLCELYYDLFHAFSNKEDLKKAAFYAKKAILSPVGSLKEKILRHDRLNQIYTALESWKEASEIAQIILVLKDSLFEQTKIQTTLDLEEKYQTEKKDLEIKNLNQEKELQEIQNKQQQLFLYSGGFVLLLILLILGILYRQYRQKQKANKLLEQKNTVIEKQNNEKEVLLKEIHHRVKNNLQIISSLLDLQSSKVHDKATASAITDGQNRVKSMALIHQKLYQNENIANINFKDYVEQLLNQILSMFNLNDVKKNIDIPIDSAFDIDTAIPLGLILNELFTNSCKYAFKDLDDKQIEVQLTSPSKGSYQLDVKDNGKGMPEDFDIWNAESLGLRLVGRLSEQLFGDVTCKNNNGAHFSIEFKDTDLRKEMD